MLEGYTLGMRLLIGDTCTLYARTQNVASYRLKNTLDEGKIDFGLSTPCPKVMRHSTVVFHVTEPNRIKYIEDTQIYKKDQHNLLGRKEEQMAH